MSHSNHSTIPAHYRNELSNRQTRYSSHSTNFQEHATHSKESVACKLVLPEEIDYQFIWQVFLYAEHNELLTTNLKNMPLAYESVVWDPVVLGQKALKQLSARNKYVCTNPVLTSTLLRQACRNMVLKLLSLPVLHWGYDMFIYALGL